MEGEPLGDKLALVLPKAVVDKLSDSLAVVIVKKLGYTGSYRKAGGFSTKSQRETYQKVETLGKTLAKVKVRYWWTPTVKN